MIIFDKQHPHESVLDDMPEDQRIAYKEVSSKTPDTPAGPLSRFAVVGLSKNVEQALAEIRESKRIVVRNHLRYRQDRQGDLCGATSGFLLHRALYFGPKRRTPEVN